MSIVQTLRAEDVRAELDGLCALLIDAVHNGASVSFMAPLSLDKARAFWSGVADSVERGERVLFVARDARSNITGTVQLVTSLPENQPHRAEVAKMLVLRSARRLGLGAALMNALEAEAARLDKTLLVLDTANPDAERLYRRAGFQLCGVIPDFALLPEGGLCATSILYKVLPGPR